MDRQEVVMSANDQNNNTVLECIQKRQKLRTALSCRIQKKEV